MTCSEARSWCLTLVESAELSVSVHVIHLNGSIRSLCGDTLAHSLPLTRHLCRREPWLGFGFWPSHWAKRTGQAAADLAIALLWRTLSAKWMGQAAFLFNTLNLLTLLTLLKVAYYSCSDLYVLAPRSVPFYKILTMFGHAPTFPMYYINWSTPNMRNKSIYLQCSAHLTFSDKNFSWPMTSWYTYTVEACIQILSSQCIFISYSNIPNYWSYINPYLMAWWHLLLIQSQKIACLAYKLVRLLCCFFS